MTFVNSDDLMWDTLRCLAADLSGYINRTDFNPGLLSREEVEKVRAFTPTTYGSPWSIKVQAQFSCWLKRYCFSEDVFSDMDRLKNTLDKVFTDFNRVGCYQIPEGIKPFLQLVRTKLRSILGEFREEEIIPLCTFSRKATVGYSGNRIYLDEKIHPNTTLSGTPPEIRWFKKIIEADHVLRDSVRGCDFLAVSHLTQIHVAKNYKTLRAVRPNTLIGSFRSIGIGRLIKQRLSDRGIDLAHGQMKHQRLAREASRNLRHVTADLSSASDSFTSHLLNAVLPRSWYRAVSFGRTPYVEIEGRIYNSPSFMAMGIGYTFDLMTAVLQATLEVICELTNSRGCVSVFGDDLIYPRRIHPHVVKILGLMGFQINSDKTFVVQPFRESCGGDYYDGQDVRPASPEGMSELLQGIPLCSYVYKLFNSLIRRWPQEAIPITTAYLRNVASSADDVCGNLSVPDHYPDTSGFKDGNWRKFLTAEVNTENRRQPYCQRYVIPYLGQTSSRRTVRHQGVYYWEKLLGNVVKSEYESATWDTLLWMWKKKRLRENGRLVKVLVAHTSEKGKGHMSLQLGYVS